MVARVLLLVAAAGLLAFGAIRARDHTACDGARRDAFAIGLRNLPATDAPAVAARLADRCRGAEQLVNGTAAFLRAGAVRPAAQLANEAVAREPQRRDSWVALARVRQRVGDASGAGRALARARALDPLDFVGR